MKARAATADLDIRIVALAKVDDTPDNKRSSNFSLLRSNRQTKKG
jgi:hypothetical protein